MTTLMQASNEWANRPADQRFKSLDELHAAVTRHRDEAAEADVNVRDLRVISKSDDQDVSRPMLVGPSGAEAGFTHYSFGQLSRIAGAPAGYLRTLPPRMAAENLNYGLSSVPAYDATSRLLFGRNGSLKLRAALSEKYTRIWNADVTSRLIQLTGLYPEWQPAPAAFDGSRGLYASDQDMFAFLVDNDRRIFERGPGGGLGRGFFVKNSEVGDASFSVTTFFYEFICGNHRVWGAQGVTEIRIPHIGNADDRAFGKLAVELRKYADSSSEQDELKVQQARKYLLGETKDEVLDAVFGLKIDGLTRKLAAQAFDLAEDHDEWYGDPKSAWGFSGGLTEIARDLPNASDRTRIEKAAGKVMQIAF